MYRTVLLAALVALLASPGAVAQNPAPPLPESPPLPKAPPPPGADAIPGSGPAALAILERAIAYQGPVEFAKAGAIKDLSVYIDTDVWDYGKVPAKKVNMKVRRYLEVEPLRFRSEWGLGPAGTEIYGYDDAAKKELLKFWYAEKDRQGHVVEARFLGAGDDHKETRDQILSEIDQTRWLLHLFFLANLKGPHVKLATMPDERIEVMNTAFDCRVLFRDNLAPGSTEPPLTLWIDRKSNALVKAKAHATADGDRSLIFRFAYNETVQPRLQGVLFPMIIDIYEQPYRAPKSRLITRARIMDDPGAIRFNQGLDAELFRRPRKDR